MNNVPLSSIYNKVKGKKHSLISEVLYNKEFEKIIFTVGAKHTQGYADNRYRGTNTSTSSMQNADSYIYTQMQGKIKDKLGYTLGIGSTRTWFKESGENRSYYKLSPSLQLSYPINNYLNIRYSFRVRTLTPSLAQLSNVEQQLDSFIISRGNPNLKPYNNFTNQLSFSYNKGIINSNLGITYSYRNKPFMRVYELDGNKILSYTDNYKSYHDIGGQLSGSVKIIKNIWTINSWIGINHYRSNGIVNSHSYTNVYGGLQSNLIYKNYTLNCSFNTRQNELWGESIYYGEKWSSIEAGYKYKDAKLALGMSLPFDDYWSGGHKTLSKVAPSESWTYIKENGQMLYLKFSWDISFGRKYKEDRKRLQNSDRDTGIL